MIATIARYSLREAVQNRLLVLLGALLLATLALVEFVGSVALTERRAIEAVIAGAVLRLGAVATVALFVTTGLLREQHERSLDLVLALDEPRAKYVLGKLSAYAAVALAIGVACAALLCLYAPPKAVAIWGLSLACEIWLVAGVALLLAVSIRHAVVALACLGGFYVLSRAMGALLLLLRDPLLGPETLADRVVVAGIEALAWVLPALHRFTEAGWLGHAVPDWRVLAIVAVQTAIYGALLAAAATFDLYRREI